MPRNGKQISRVTRSKEIAKASYDRMSKWYDFLAGTSEWKFTKTGLELLDAHPGERILEIGFGTGRGILSLADSVGDTGRVYGIDLSEGMFQIATSRVEKAGLAGRVDLRCGDASELPHGSNSFDAVFISFTLELFDTPEIPLVLGECRRVLRDGGRITVVAMSKAAEPSLASKLYNWAHQALPNYVDCRPIFVSESLTDAGFRVANRKQMSMWGLPVDAVLGTAQ
jgi:demethylmenaquinone methyltransferase/2-methoxy-6-polyprenyl-1,4-benzoquinol methylase